MERKSSYGHDWALGGLTVSETPGCSCRERGTESDRCHMSCVRVCASDLQPAISARVMFVFVLCQNVCVRHAC